MPTDLFDEHRIILKAIEEIARAVDRTPRIRLDELSRMRVQIGNLVRVHRIAEEQEIMGPLQRSGDPELVARVTPVVAQLRATWAGYSEHIRTWTPRAIENDWDRYAELLVNGVTSFRHMMAREEEEIYRPVLAHIAATQLASSRRTYVGGLRA